MQGTELLQVKGFPYTLEDLLGPDADVSEWRDGSVFVFPGLHQMRVYSMRDQTYRPEQVSRADGPAPLQSLEGLSLGVDLAVRYALDPEKKEIRRYSREEIIEAAKAAAPYMHPRLAAIEHTGEGGGAIRHSIRVKFG